MASEWFLTVNAGKTKGMVIGEVSAGRLLAYGK